MPNYTDELNLKKTDMSTDGDDFFLFDDDLDDNWDKIDARFKPVDIIITSGDWEGDSAPYTQTIEIEGMTAKINPHAALLYSDDYDTVQNERSEFSKIYNGKTGENKITFYATSPTGIDLNIRLKQL